MASADIVNCSNDFDFGICTDDLSIKIVTIADNQVPLKGNEFVNPFFIGLNNKSQLDSIDEKQLYTMYKRVLVMCMHMSYQQESEAERIFNMILTKEDLQALSKYFALVSCTRRILYSGMQYKRGIRIEREYLEYFNHNSIKLDNDEIIIPMFELKEDMAKLHISLYDTSTTISDIPNVFSLNNYYNSDYQNRTQRQLSQIILGIKESDYWVTPHNCNITMTNQFMERSFQWKEILTDKIKDTIISKTITNERDDDLVNVLDKLAKNDDGYNLTHLYKPDIFVDLSNALKSQNKRTYYATVDNNELNITREQVSELFESLTSEKEMYDLFNTLLISKEYCHMVLNNYQVLSKMKPLINRFTPLYKYLLGYAWTSFYIEECLFKTKTTKNSRYVFDIRTGNLLPVFPFCSDDIYQNPYVTFLVSEKVSELSNNCMSLSMFEDHNGYGIDTLERFRWKFNLFTTGDPTKNIFDGLEWGNRYAISGSIIPAFLQVKSPLFDLVVNRADPEYKQWLTYFGHYYSDSDIDFMCNDESVFDFIDSINNVKQLVERNLSIVGEQVKVQVEPIRSTTIVINGQYLTEKLNEIREYVCKPELTVEQTLANLSSNEIKEYFYGTYTDNKRKNNRAQRVALKSKPVNPMYEDYFKVSSIDDINIVVVTYEIDKDSTVAKDCETCFYVNDFRTPENKVTNEKNIMLLKIAENIKFKFRSERMLHCIEAFRVKSNDFFSVVGRFHLPCVRGYYNGDTAYLMPSCITANMTGINIDYKYFAGVRDPIDILNKYRMRGFGTILNSVERHHMTFYNGNVNKWGKMFAVDPKDKGSVKCLYGFKDIHHDIFKPGHFLKGFPIDSFNKINRKQIKSIDDIKRFYKAKYGYDPDKIGLDMFKFKTISPDGAVTPLNKWVINACWDLINKA